MKMFMFLHQCSFLHVNPPTQLTLHEFGPKVTEIKCQSADFTQTQDVDLLPPPVSLPNQRKDLENHLSCYRELRKTIFQNFKTVPLTLDQGHRIRGVPYTHFTFAIYENPQSQGHQSNMEYQLKMGIRDDYGNNWFKVLRQVCGGEDKVKISVSLEIGRKGVNGEVLKCNLWNNGMTIVDFNGSCYCVGPNLIGNQVEELMALLNCGTAVAVPWQVFTGKVTISLEIDDDIELFTKTAPVSPPQVNLRILESEIDANVEIYPGGFGNPVRCHHSFLAIHSPVLMLLLQRPSPRQGQMKRIDMPEASEKCVRCLLRYLYTGNLLLDGEEEEDIILLELWKVSREYQFVELEKIMKDKLRDKQVSGYSVGLAIDLFCFARNLVGDDAGRRLKEKAVQVLKSKLESDDLELAPEYHQLFENDPLAARDLVKCAFQA